MKRKYLLISIILLFISVVFFVVNMYIKNNSNNLKKIAEKVRALLEINQEDLNYNEIYNELNVFFGRENYEEIIKQYYNSVLKFDTEEDAFVSLCAYYDSAMMHLEKYEEFQKSLNEKRGYCEKYDKYFISLWTLGIVCSKEDNLFDSKRIFNIIENTKFEDDEFEISKSEFLYYFSKYFDIKVSDDFSSINDSKRYSNSRSQYVLTFLYVKNYSDFEKMFLSEYINAPFIGADILVLINNKNVLDVEQLDQLNESLEKLKEKYKVKYPETYNLSKDKIEILQDKIKDRI